MHDIFFEEVVVLIFRYFKNLSLCKTCNNIIFSYSSQQVMLMLTVNIF